MDKERFWLLIKCDPADIVEELCLPVAKFVYDYLFQLIQILEILSCLQRNGLQCFKHYLNRILLFHVVKYCFLVAH